MADVEILESRAIVTRAEAKSLRLRRYYTGEPCHQGHIAERAVSNHVCIVCKRITQSARRAAKPEREKEIKAAYRLAHKEVLSQRRKDRYKLERDIILARQKASRSKYADRVRAYAAAYRLASFNQLKEYISDWRGTNKDKVKNHRRTRRARLNKAPGKHTSSDILVLFHRQAGKCAYCAKSIKRGYHIDHIQPISKGGSNLVSNLALACQPCNLRKNAKDPLVFAREIGRLL